MFTLSILIFSLLIVATLYVRFQLSFNHSYELISNQKRIQTWWLICLLCITILYLGAWALNFLIYGLIYWAAFELSQLLNFRISINRILILTIVVVSYDFSMRYSPKLVNLFFLLPILILLLSILFVTLTKTRAVLLLLFCISSLLSLQLISQLSHNFGYDSGLIILFLLFMTSVNDILQYLCGRLFGRTQLAPQLSPNKTVEGALGGVLLTGIIFYLTLPHIINVTGFVAILIGFFISILGIIGDLHFSYYKRRANVKESGSSLPGHGGLLDRIDSLTLTAPGFGLCLNLVN